MAKTLIREAIEYLRTHGWYKGDNGTDTHVCAMRARNLVGGYSTLRRDLYAMDAVAEEQYPDRMSRYVRPMADFNDHPDTTFDEVIAVMEKAAIRREEEVG